MAMVRGVILAASAVAPRVLPRLGVLARELASLVTSDAPRVLPRLGVLARELASPPVPLARHSTAGGAPPLSLARIPLAASPAALLPDRSVAVPPLTVVRIRLAALPVALRSNRLLCSPPLARLVAQCPASSAAPRSAARSLGATLAVRSVAESRLAPAASAPPSAPSARRSLSR